MHYFQFHWQDYNDKAYLDALFHLQNLQAEGYIANIGLCNFDTKRTDEICTLLGPGAIVSNQVQVREELRFRSSHNYVTDCSQQFSIIDSRPLHGMGDVCMKHGLKLLTYGTLVRCSSVPLSLSLNLDHCLMVIFFFSAGIS